jgi:uncharacterized protein with LGFP repeats
MRATSVLRDARRRVIATAATLAIALTALVAGSAPAAAEPAQPERAIAAAALSGSQFNAGYIIDDANFYQKSAMTQAQIQSFLASKVTCANSYCLANLYTKTEVRLPDRGICNGYTPDSDALERASTIIYKMQQSCGISARVILVTLQKEQGLITMAAPTLGRLNAAMGYRCPDTAPCANSAAGFFRQIYGGTWQFKRYNTPDLWGTYHIGTYSIAYSTLASCGRKTVTIRNNATAALYNYTPYTPNAGALANLYGTAPCGSYGNRNFWVFYNQWFGSPLAGAGNFAISSAYTASGGATGPLGAQTSTGSCGLTTTTCSRTYEHGVIYWSAPVGALLVSGAIGDYYLSRGGVKGVLGVPSKNAVAMAGGANGDGFNQPFANGLVSSSASGIFAMLGTYRSAHAALGGIAGPMGWPISERACTLPNGACSQTFQHGVLASTSATTAALAILQPEIVAYYTANAAMLRVPTGSAVAVTGGANGDGFTQTFVGGLVATSANGTFGVYGGVRTKHSALGGVAGPLGWPTAERVCGLPGGTCSQAFQHGTIYASATMSGAITVPAIADYYAANGGPTGALGVPKQDSVPMAGGGFNQPFTNALVTSSPAGTFRLVGLIRTAHGRLGGVAGSLGYPTAEQVCGLPGGGCSQTFQNGTIYSYGTVAYAVSRPAIVAYYATAGGPTGPLGYPTRDAVPMATTSNGNGYNQPFQGGLVSSSSLGTFSLKGAIRTKHGALGGVGGVLGWPTADQVCGLPDNGCSQTFQHGKITADAKGVRVSYT